MAEDEKKSEFFTRKQMDETEDMDWEEENEKRNTYFLNLFEEDLTRSGLKPGTIGRHLSNAETFLHELAFREGWYMEQCLEDPGQFLGNWFVRRCMWSTPANVKTTAASIKKFAKSMADHGIITKDEYNFAVSEIKDNLPEWQDNCAWYNSSSGDFDEDEFISRFGI